MKYKTTFKAIREGYCTIYRIPYCDAQNLLYYIEPTAYTAGIYGWNCDIYDFGNIAICTGYRPIGEIVNRELLKKYEKKAENIRFDNSRGFGSYEKKKRRVNKLLNKYLQELTGFSRDFI